MFGLGEGPPRLTFLQVLAAMELQVDHRNPGTASRQLAVDEAVPLGGFRRRRMFLELSLPTGTCTL